MKKTKKNYKTTLVIVFFFIFVFFMAVLRPGVKSSVIYLSIPDNKGIPRLTSMGADLVASGNSGEFYIFKWSDIEGEYSTFPSLSERSILLNQSPLLSLSYIPGDLVALDKDSKEHFRIPVDKNIEEAYLVDDQSQKNFVFVEKVSENNGFSYICKKISVEKQYLSYLVDLGSYQKYELRTFALSDNAEMFVAAGRREDRGYIVLVDMKTQKVVWEKEIVEERDFSSICFSTDGKTLFSGSEDGTISMFNTETGKRIKTVVLVNEPRSNTNSRAIQTLTASSKGKWIACVCDPAVFILDQKTCTLSDTFLTKHKIVTGIAFSPDETMLATSDLRASGVISVIDLNKVNEQ